MRRDTWRSAFVILPSWAAKMGPGRISSASSAAHGHPRDPRPSLIQDKSKIAFSASKFALFQAVQGPRRCHARRPIPPETNTLDAEHQRPVSCVLGSRLLPETVIIAQNVTIGDGAVWMNRISVLESLPEDPPLKGR